MNTVLSVARLARSSSIRPRSIFATILGGTGGSLGVGSMTVAAVDLDNSKLSAQMIDALDGYLKVFWYDDPALSLAGSLLALAPQLAMLAAMTAAFLAVARWLARRWETV